MDFRLQVFLKVAQHLSYTKAAKELGVSQPAITKHIQELESQYKVQLFAKQNG
ncbi:MAG: LysR family transcriptional regulator, partial [Bacteroidales bacterium]|nr:LysR family transcriptional regulator [Bacteroidales bacterium]